MVERGIKLVEKSIYPTEYPNCIHFTRNIRVSEYSFKPVSTHCSVENLLDRKILHCGRIIFIIVNRN